MRIGLTSRIFLSMAVCAFLLGIAGLYVWQHFAYQTERENLSVRIATSSVRLSKAMVGAADRGDRAAIRSMISAFASSPEIVCVDLRLRKYDIAESWPADGCAADKAELMLHRQPIRRAVRVLGEVDLYFTNTFIRAGIADFTNVIVLGIGIMLAGMLAVKFLIHRIEIDRPILDITRALEAAASGRLDVSLKGGRRAPEFQQIALAFDDMIAKLLFKDKEIQQSFDYAKMIQDGIVGLEPGLFDAGFEVEADQEQLSQIGGDFYAGIDLGSKYVIFFADATGHGVSGAMATMLLASSLRNTAHRLQAEDRADMWLEKIHKRFVEGVSAAGRDTGHSELGADAALVMIDKATYTISYASAGIPVFVKTAEGIFVRPYDRTSIGYDVAEPKLDCHEIVLRSEGDSLVFVTDGILDQPGGDKGFGLGKTRFLAMLDDCDDAQDSAAAILHRIKSHLAGFAGSHAAVDDRTALVLRRRHDPPAIVKTSVS